MEEVFRLHKSSCFSCDDSSISMLKEDFLHVRTGAGHFYYYYYFEIEDASELVITC